jgi:hypothetical protein
VQRSTIIANCLLNSSMVKRLEDGEQAVRNVFHEEFPDERFEEWNREVSQSVADHVINTVGRASRINVGKFIDDLRDA